MSALNAASTATAGAAGTTAGFAPPQFGATAGTAGIVQVIPITQTPTFPVLCNTLLKGNFLSVSASAANEAVTIYWQMSGETGAETYTIEKSFDGAAFSPAGSMACAQNAAASNSYTYKDVSAGYNHAVVYYRVRCTTADGYTMLSKTVDLTQNTAGRKMTVTPNPVTTGASIRFFAAHNALLSVRLTALSGKTVLVKQYPVYQGMNAISLNGLQAVSNGVYLLQTDDGTNRESTKLVIQH